MKKGYLKSVVLKSGFFLTFCFLSFSSLFLIRQFWLFNQSLEKQQLLRKKLEFLDKSLEIEAEKSYVVELTLQIFPNLTEDLFALFFKKKDLDSVAFFEAGIYATEKLKDQKEWPLVWNGLIAEYKKNNWAILERELNSFISLFPTTIDSLETLQKVIRENIKKEKYQESLEKFSFKMKEIVEVLLEEIVEQEKYEKSVRELGFILLLAAIFLWGYLFSRGMLKGTSQEEIQKKSEKEQKKTTLLPVSAPADPIVDFWEYYLLKKNGTRESSQFIFTPEGKFFLLKKTQELEKSLDIGLKIFSQIYEKLEEKIFLEIKIREEGKRLFLCCFFSHKIELSFLQNLKRKIATPIYIKIFRSKNKENYLKISLELEKIYNEDSRNVSNA